MTSEWKDEATYDRDRLERAIARERAAHRISRREALRSLAAIGLGAAAFAGGARFAFAQTTPTIVKPTPPEIFRVLGTNRETLWEALKGTGYLTPSSHFFVRNHTRTPLLDLATYRLRIHGTGVRRPLALRYEDVLAMRSVTRTKAIECAGNARSYFVTQQGEPQTPGTQWRLGAIGVAQWTGVPLGDILDRAGLRRTAVDVLPEGLDDPINATDGRVRRPLSIEKALDDVLVVHSMNGDPLPEDHGFPLRLLVPGWIGVANIKWLGRIEVSETPLFSAWNTTQYRLFGDAHPDSPPLTTQGVKSAFELPYAATLTPGWHLLTGRSWSAHGRIRKVEVRFDGGRWWPAVLDRRNEPQAWVRWSIPWNARTGAHVLEARATDQRGNTQPATTTYNTLGYLFDAVVRHSVTVA